MSILDEGRRLVAGRSYLTDTLLLFPGRDYQDTGQLL